MGRHCHRRHHRDELPVHFHRCLLLPRLYRQGLPCRSPGLAPCRSPGLTRRPRPGPAAGVGAEAGREGGRRGSGSVVWLCAAAISGPGSGAQLVIGGCGPCEASVRRRPLRRRRARRAAVAAVRGVAVGVKHRGQPPEERDHCDDGDDDGGQARSCHVIPSLRSGPACRDRARGSRRAPPPARAPHTARRSRGGRGGQATRPDVTAAARRPACRLRRCWWPVHGALVAWDSHLRGPAMWQRQAQNPRGRRPRPGQTGMGRRSWRRTARSVTAETSGADAQNPGALALPAGHNLAPPRGAGNLPDDPACRARPAKRAHSARACRHGAPVPSSPQDPVGGVGSRDPC